MNRCPPNVWNAVRRDAAILEEQKIRYVLIGTAALAVQGIAVEVPDADFLVDKLPKVEAVDAPETEGSSRTDCVATVVDGIKIDHIDVKTKKLRKKGFLETPTIVVDGVNVAAVRTVMAIKKAAGRPKDIDFAFELASQVAEAA